MMIEVIDWSYSSLIYEQVAFIPYPRATSYAVRSMQFYSSRAYVTASLTHI
jgi:hypothetical protein